MQDRAIMDIVPLVELEVVQDQLACESYMDVVMEDGEVLHGETAVVLGHPDNPMDWDDLLTKFRGLVEPILGEEKTQELYEIVHNFETPGSLARMTELVRAA